MFFNTLKLDISGNQIKMKACFFPSGCQKARTALPPSALPSPWLCKPVPSSCPQLLPVLPRTAFLPVRLPLVNSSGLLQQWIWKPVPSSFLRTPHSGLLPWIVSDFLPLVCTPDNLFSFWPFATDTFNFTLISVLVINQKPWEFCDWIKYCYCDASQQR